MSVSRDISHKEEMQKEYLAVSLCKDSKGNRFWLLHKAAKITVPSPEKVDLDELNNDLDSLINT